MNQGKRTCDILKEIRKNIATNTNIELNQTECSYKGECSGTCPKCEKELEKINKNLDHKKLLSIVSALSTTTILTGCVSSTNRVNTNQLEGDVEINNFYDGIEVEENNSLKKQDEDIFTRNMNEINDTKNIEEYVFAEENIESENFKNIDSLEISSELKNLLKSNFQKNKLQGVINPNASFRKL